MPTRLVLSLPLVLALGLSTVSAQTTVLPPPQGAPGSPGAPPPGAARPKPDRPGHKLRVKIDSSPPQAAIYIDSKDYGIEGYTPSTLKLPKGTYTVILELPGFAPVQRPITVTRSQGFLFTLERQARPAVLDVRASAANDSANGGQLFVDGAAVGAVPGRIEVPPGNHVIEVKKAGFANFRDSAEVHEGETRSMLIELAPDVKKGSILVTSDQPGADVYLDGQRRDQTPALLADVPEGPHTVEVRKDPLPGFRQIVNVVGGQQQKVIAQLQQAPTGGSLRIVSSTPAAHVFVDGEDKGPVNTEISGLQPGQHLIEVRAPGFAPQPVDANLVVVAGEVRVARAELTPAAPVNQNARLRVVTPVPDAEVFIDGASAGRAPFDRNDLPPGHHYVVVRKPGFQEYKREVDLNPASPTVLSVELSSAGSLKILGNVPGATVLIDGQVMGHTPIVLDSIPAGEHMVEVKQPGYVDARQAIHLDGGEQKILAADLTPVHTGPTPADMARLHKSESSFSAMTLRPGRFTADLMGGYVPFGSARLTVGAFRRNNFGLDTGIELRTTGYFTEGGVHAKLELLQAGPFVLGTTLFIGGGGGPSHRNDFLFELGVPMTLLFGELVRFTIDPYLQVYSDRNCESVSDLKSDYGSDNTTSFGSSACQAKDSVGGTNRISGAAGTPNAGLLAQIGQDPRDRFTSARLMLRAVLEIVIVENVNLVLLFEGAPTGERQSLTDKFGSVFPVHDAQIYGNAGITFKF